MTNITEKTAPNVSVGADTEQPSLKSTANIITTEDEKFKSFEEIQRKTKNEILNSTARLCGRFYSCTVDIYSFIQKCYCYLSF